MPSRHLHRLCNPSHLRPPPPIRTYFVRAGPCGLHQTAIAPTFQFTETLSSRCPPPPPKPPAPCRGIFCNIDIFRPGINIVDLVSSAT